MNATFHPSSAPVATVRLFLFAAWLSVAAFVFVFPVRAQTTITYTGNSSAPISTSAGGAILDVPSGSFTQSGVISGTGWSVSKTGAGTLALSGANTYVGNTYIQDGTLVAANNSAFGIDAANPSNSVVYVYGSTAFLVINSGVTLGKIVYPRTGGTVDNRGTLESAAPVWSARGAINVINTGIIRVPAIYTGNAALWSWDEACTLINTGGTVEDSQGPTVLYEIGGTVTNQSGGKILSVAVDKTALTLSGGVGPNLLNNLTNGLIEGGNGVTFAGGTLTNDASTIRGTAGTGVDLNSSGLATLNNGNLALIEGLKYGVTAESANDQVSNTGGATIQSGSVAGGGIAGVYITASGAGVVNSGTGSKIIGAQKGVWLAAGGTITNSATITGGTGASDAGVLFAAAAGTLTNNGTINGKVTFGNFANTATLNAGSQIVGNLAMGTSASARINLGGASGTQVYSSAVTGTTTFSGILTKQDAGTWVVDKAFSHAGATTVQAGTLLVNSTFSGATALSVESGATLGGTGSLGGNVTLQSGGRIAPGAGIGTLTLAASRSLTWNPGGTVVCELGTAGSSDKIAIGAALTKGTTGTGGWTFDFGGAGEISKDYTVATFASTSFSVGDFTATNLAPGVTGQFILNSTSLHFVTDGPTPLIISSSTANGTYGSVFNFAVIATGSPTSYSMTGTLPAGLMFNSNGTITGTPTAAGTSTVTVRADNADGFGTASLAITIAKVTVTPVVTVASRAYNATTGATIATRSLTGAIAGDDVSLTGGTATFTSANVSATRTANITGLTLSGTAAGNYTLSATTATATAAITAAPLTPTVTINDKAYNRTTTATIASRSLTGIINSQSVTLTGGTATFADANAGVGKTVTITALALSGSAASNYALVSTTATATATITPVSVTPTVTISNRPYDGTMIAAIATRSLTGVLSPDVVVLAGGTATFADAGIGTAKPVNVTGLTLDGAAALNYTLSATTATASANITTASVTPVFTIAGKAYDSTSAATIATRSLTGIVGSEAVTLTGGTATFADANAAVAKTVTITGFSLTGTDAGNYTLGATTATASATITAAPLTPVVAVNTKIYDGATTATIATRSLTGIIGSDAVTLTGGTATFADAKAEPAKTVTVTGLALNGGAAGNYALVAAPVTATAAITPAPVGPVVTISDRIYTGATNATIATRSLTGVIGSDVVTLTDGVATFADANVGPAKTVNVTGLTLGGAAAGNYTLTTTTLTASAAISAAPLTPIFTVDGKVYDRTTTANIATRSLTGIVDGAAVTLTGGTGTFADAKAGPAKTVTITGFALGGTSANYTLAASTATATATITPAQVAPTVTVNDRTYDATTVASIATRSLTGVISTDVVTLTGGSATFADAKAGVAKTVTITGLTLDSSDAGNYALTSTTASATANITTASVTPVFAVSGKIYDGTVNAKIVAMSLSGVFSGDDVRLAGATATFADPAVGSGKPVTITGFTLAGGSSANYILATTSVTKTANIDDPPRTVVIALGNLNQAYDGTPRAVSVVTDPAGISVAVTYDGSNLPPTDPGRYAVIATTSSPEYDGVAVATLVIAPAVGPMSSKVSATIDGPATFSAPATGGGAMTFQWQKNGVDLPGETGPTLTLLRTQPTDVGFYSLVVTSNGVTTRSAAIPLELSFAGKIAGSGVEVGSDIQHPNGNIYDQVLLTGPAVSVKADPGQVVRVSYVDLTDDIVQVEFSGAGVLTLTLDNPSGPAPAANYDQPGVNYMKGHGSVVITGADATTNLAVFSVGRITAVNQGLFRAGVTYDGWADLAFVGLSSATGEFGGVRAGNATFFQAKGLTGVYAAGVQVAGPMIIGDISASDTARPALVFGAAADVRVAGGDLYQANSSPVEVDGLTRLLFVAGTTSAGTSLPAQPNRARLVRNGIDVTNELVP